MTDKSQHTFSSELNSFQRRIVHEIAEEFKLYHESRGEEKRFIVVSTKPFVTSQPEAIVSGAQSSDKNEVEEVVSLDDVITDQAPQEETESKASKKKKKNQANKSSQPAPVAPKPQSTKQNLLGEIQDQDNSDLVFRSDCKKCPHCEKFILTSNFTMHEMHCSKITAQKKQQQHEESSSKKPGKSSSDLKKEKLKKNPIESSKTDDFDELIDMFRKSNDVCNYTGCKTLVKTLGQNCEFCSHRFCLQHSLAEVFNLD